MSESLADHLPVEAVEMLKKLQVELKEGDITPKGYEKKRAELLSKYSIGRKVENVIKPKPEVFIPNRRLQQNLKKRSTFTPDDSRLPSQMASLNLNRNGSINTGQKGSGPTSPLPSPLSPHVHVGPDLTVDIIMNTSNMSSVTPAKMPLPDIATHKTKISEKIRQLANTLMRPKRKPLEQYFEDDGTDDVPAEKVDPCSPKPEGVPTKPFSGDPLQEAYLSINPLSALQNYALTSKKASAFSVLDSHGKVLMNITYGKLYRSATDLAYTLLNKTPPNKDGASLHYGDRVALVHGPDEPISYAQAWLACVLAGLVPVQIDILLTREDPGSSEVGFLLCSCAVSWVITSESTFKVLPKDETGHITSPKGWPKLTWIISSNPVKRPKDWVPPGDLNKDRSAPAFLEPTYKRDGTAMGVVVSKQAVLHQTAMLVQACSYAEGEVMVMTIDIRREIGLWHGLLVALSRGMHVMLLPPSAIRTSAPVWISSLHKHKASVSLVGARVLSWASQSYSAVKDVNLSSVRMVLVCDMYQSWTVTVCDTFLKLYAAKNLSSSVLNSCAFSSEALTYAIRRMSGYTPAASGRGFLSLLALSYGVVRIESEGNATALSLQDCGTVAPGVSLAVLKLDKDQLCRSDEVGELCVMRSTPPLCYWGLSGRSNSTFKVRPTFADGVAVSSDAYFTRTGYMGFMGPNGLVFVSGKVCSLIRIQRRLHSADDIRSTVLSVEPVNFVFGGRICVFSVSVLREERIVIVAEQKPGCTEEESHPWMSSVLPAVDSVHQVGVYCICLLNPDTVPMLPSGTISVHETRKRFLEGNLHPVSVLVCPHTCVTNLPSAKPRDRLADRCCLVPGPAACLIGNMVKGNRIAEAVGKELSPIHPSSGESDSQTQQVTEMLHWRAQTDPELPLFTLLNFKCVPVVTLTAVTLWKRVKRTAAHLAENSKWSPRDIVVVLASPGVDLIVALLACMYLGVLPVPIRAPTQSSLSTNLATIHSVLQLSRATAVVAVPTVAKLLKSKDVGSVETDVRSWPPIISLDESSRTKRLELYHAQTPETLAYLDFCVTPMGSLYGLKVSHSSLAALCRSHQQAAELYPSRELLVCLDPFSGFNLVLWCFSSIFSGHHTYLIPPVELDQNPSLFVMALSQYKIRDAYFSYPIMEFYSKTVSPQALSLQGKQFNLSAVRTCIAVGEERPRQSLVQTFTTLFTPLGLSPRAVGTLFGGRTNAAISTQDASRPETSVVYVDTRALRSDRIKVVERGSPYSVGLMECGKMLPGTKVVVADPETCMPCGDSYLGEIWVSSGHNAVGCITQGQIGGDQWVLSESSFSAQLTLLDRTTVYARTGFLGFIRRLDITQTDGSPYDALFVVGCMEEMLLLRGFRYCPVDVESSVIRSHRSIVESAVFVLTKLLVVVVEIDCDEREAMDVVPLVTSSVLEDHQLIVGVVVVVDLGTIPLNSRGEKQRVHLRERFAADELDPIYVVYNL